LDIYTIYSELAKQNIRLDSESRDPLVVTFMGDLKHSRTIHSLVHMLTLFPKITFVYLNPITLEMPEEIMMKVHERGIEQRTHLTLEEAISATDVLYVTRIQKERFANLEDYAFVDSFKDCIDTACMSQAKSSMILMHPLPRLDEISTEVDSDPRAVYFKQVENGVYMRMAILDTLFR
jgi:carbamoyl-phosphate synthase/aspartate carbamoyltransferase/dihydroorotase